MIYTIRRFSDDEKSGMGLGTKLAIGAGTLALGFGAAKSGMFGAGLQKGTNTMWFTGGEMLKNKGMMVSGAKGIGNAEATKKAAELSKNLAEGAKIDQNVVNQVRKQATRDTLNNSNAWKDVLANEKKANLAAKTATPPPATNA